MNYDDVVLGRRSTRGYKPDPVPKDLIKEVLSLAMRSPSSMNTQPWNFTVVSGEVLNRIRQGNTERNLAGVPHSREFRIGQPFEGVHRDRQVGVAKQLFGAMGIARDDKEGRGGRIDAPGASSSPTTECLPANSIAAPRPWSMPLGLVACVIIMHRWLRDARSRKCLKAVARWRRSRRTRWCLRPPGSCFAD